MTQQEQSCQTPTLGLGVLNEEHSEIHRRYLALDDAILRMQSAPRVVQAAGDLMRSVLLHLAHEEQFLEKLSFAVLQDNRRAEMEMLTQICEIESQLQSQQVSAALRLRGLCKEWITEHLYVESEGFEIAATEALKDWGRIQA